MSKSMDVAAEKLRAFLGAWGCQTSMLSPDDLVDVAVMAFDVRGSDLETVARNIERLGRRERSARIREAIRKHWPQPTVLWPANAPVRKLLAKEPH